MAKKMNRQEFVTWIAQIGAGLDAAPAQIEAYKRYYEVNAPHTDDDLICVDEIMIGGIAEKSLPVTVEIFEGDECILPFGMNLFGGFVRWIATGDQKIVMPADSLSWRITATSMKDDELNKIWREGISPPIKAHISYIDQTGLRMRLPMRTPRGHLAKAAE